MAAKPRTKLILFLILILAGIGATIFARSRFFNQGRGADNRFISTYLAMSIARERHTGNPDSLKIALGEIFARYGTDSIWMANYSNRLARDLVKSERIWLEITSRLDSLRKTPNPDSVLAEQYRR